MPDNLCEKCRLFLVHFPACISSDAKLEPGEKVTKCRNKAKKKHAKCGICRKYGLKASMKPLNHHTWILEGGRDVEVDPEMLVCPPCREKMVERTKEVKKTAKKLGVSAKFLKSTQLWIQEGRAPTEEEFSKWVRRQHKRACREYVAAYPLKSHNGKCQHMIEFHRPCVSFFSHTGICETGYFVPERMPFLILSRFNKQARKAAREVRKELHG